MSAPKSYIRPSLNAIAVPIVGEFILGISVAMAGLYLASQTSDAAAGAFGMTQQVVETLAVLFRVLAIGIGVVVTQKLGSNNTTGAKRTALGAIGAATWVGAVAALWMLFGNGFTLRALNAPEPVLVLAQTYMIVLAPALILEAYNLSMAAVLRANLLAKESFAVMVVMHGSHLLFAWLLMLGFWGWGGLGLNGFAVAWLLSRAIGVVVHLWLWRSRLAITPQRKHWWHVPRDILKPVLTIGLPAAALELCYRLAFLVSVGAVASLGVAALATHAYTLQILLYVSLTSRSLGWACEIMAGRLVGAGRFKEAYTLVLKGTRSGLIASGLMAVSAALLAPWILPLFTKDPAVIRLATWLLWLSLFLELGRVFNMVMLSSLRAVGDSHYPLAASILSIIFILGFGSYWFGHWFGLIGIWVAYIVDECLRGAFMMRRWYTLGWVSKGKVIYRRLHADNRLTDATHLSAVDADSLKENRTTLTSVV